MPCCHGSFVLAGRDYVLRRAKSAALTLDAQDSQPFDKWRQQLRSTQLALSARGILPSSLTLSGSGNDIRAQLVPGALMGVGAGITHLSYKPSPPDDPARTALLKDTVAALTGLQSLQLCCPCAIPSPSLLPNLTALTAFVAAENFPDNPQHVPHEQLGRSIGALLPQLHSLALPAHDKYLIDAGPSQLFNHIFTQGHTHTLTHLSFDANLHDTLMDLLLEHAPGLRKLSVYDLELAQDHSRKEWRLEQLMVEQEPETPLVQLSRLPGSSFPRRIKVGLCTAEPAFGLEVCVENARVSHAHSHAHTADTRRPTRFMGNALCTQIL